MVCRSTALDSTCRWCLLTLAPIMFVAIKGLALVTLAYLAVSVGGQAGFSPEMFVSVVKVYTNVHEARGENL